MADIRFYHLQNQSLEQVLPVLLTKAMAKGEAICVYMRDSGELERMNSHLWSAVPDSFLPHGTSKDKIDPDKQPIFLTDDVDANPNVAKIAFLTQGVKPNDLQCFDLVCNVFDGKDQEAVQVARGYWKELNAAKEEKSYDLTYWQQSSSGGWDKKA